LAKVPQCKSLSCQSCSTPTVPAEEDHIGAALARLSAPFFDLLGNLYSSVRSRMPLYWIRSSSCMCSCSAM
jgi:hypothetical protein